MIKLENTSRLLQRPLHKAYRFEEYVFSWAAKFSVSCFLVGSGGLSAVMIYIGNKTSIQIILASLLFGLFCSGIGSIYALVYRASQFDDMMLESLLQEIEPAKKEEPKEKSKKREHEIFLDLNNGHGAIRIWQPRPTAFISWLRSVLDNSKISFSQNQALARGWTIEQYQLLILQLKSIGLLHSTDTNNGVPICTDTGLSHAKRWLEKNG